MNSGCFVFIATSLDGFIARPDGSIDWLEEANRGVPPGEDCGYADFIGGMDALVMGRLTFDLVRSFPEWPYGTLPVHVLSSTLAEPPEGAPATVTVSDTSPASLVQRLSQAGLRRLYIDGGVTIQRFLRAGLIDEITVTRIPILLGTGRPLFGDGTGDVRLEHLRTRVYPFGFVQSTYRVMREAGRTG